MNPERAFELLEEKKELMERFLSLTEKQVKAVEENDYDSVFSLLNEKGSIIERVNLIDLELVDTPEMDEDTFRGILEDIRDIVSRAIDVDERNIELLKENKTEITEKLKDTRANKKTHSLYRGEQAKIEGILLDKKK